MCVCEGGGAGVVIDRLWSICIHRSFTLQVLRLLSRPRHSLTYIRQSL